MKISSIVLPNTRAILNANGSDGSYLPVSIALTLCRETSSFCASNCCDHPSSARNAFSRLSNVVSPRSHVLYHLRNAESHEEHGEADKGTEGGSMSD